MKKHGIEIILLSIFLFSISCSTMRYNINQNNEFTEKQIINLFKKNGNVFYLSSTYTSFSTIWTYNFKEIEIYKLVKGKRNKKETISKKELIQYANIAFKDIEKELYQKCDLELDGDMFGFRVNINGKIYNKDFPIDINCLKKGTYKSDFLNKIVNDIKIYNMWEIEYQ